MGSEEPLTNELDESAEHAREEHSVRDAYGLALVLLLASALGLIVAGVPVRSPLAIVAALLQVVALVLTLRVSGVRRGSYRGGLAVAAALFIATTVLSQLGTVTATAITVAMWLVLVLATIAAIAKRLATYRQVTLQLVLGLLCVYVLIGLSFAFAYLLVDTTVADSFKPYPIYTSGAVYYSFITLATVGYGDVTPVASTARALAVAESVFGQLYLVSVVSLAVSRLGREKRGAIEESE